MRTIERSAIYTGGGVYVYTGKLTNGNYFLGDSEGSAMFLNAPVDSDDCFYWEWQEAHLVKELDELEAEDFIFQILTEILEHGCTGESNYNDADIRRTLEIYRRRIEEREV